MSLFLWGVMGDIGTYWIKCIGSTFVFVFAAGIISTIFYGSYLQHLWTIPAIIWFYYLIK